MLNGDSLCTGETCKTVKKDGFLVEKKGLNSWWSTQFVHVDGFDAPINRTFAIQSTNATELLFVETDFHTVEAHILKQGINKLKLNKIQHYQAWRVIYGALFSLLCISILFLFYYHRQNIIKIFYSVPIYSVILAIIIIIEYIIVFPGIFPADTVVSELSSGDFSVWFSPTYMIFNRLIACLYPDFIQLPEIILFYVASVYLASLLKTVRYGKITIVVLFLLQIIIPTFFVAIFVQQRIFLAIIVLYAAIIFACGNILEQKKITPIAYGFLIFASLLRPEYWLIFLIFLVNDAWIRKKKLSLSVKPVFFTLISAIFCYLFITYPLTWIQGSNLYVSKLNYQLISLLDIAKPYVDCNDKNNKLSQAIEKMGSNETEGLKEYCSTTPEHFFWKRGHLPDAIIKVNNTIKKELFKNIKNNPEPSIKRIFLNIEQMSTQKYWQIYDRYSNITNETASVHVQKAERFGLMKNYLWQSKIYIFTISIFSQLSNFLNVLISLFFIIIFVPIISRCWLTIVFNSAFLLMTVMIGFAAPVAQWYYLVFIPIWSVLAIPIDMILFANKENLHNKN